MALQDRPTGDMAYWEQFGPVPGASGSQVPVGTVGQAGSVSRTTDSPLVGPDKTPEWMAENRLPFGADPNGLRTLGSTPPAGVNLDPQYLEGQIRDAWRRIRGGEIPPDQLQYWMDKATNPDIYSDGKIRVGWNPYWEARMSANDTGSADPSLAGDAGVIGVAPQGGGQTLGGFSTGYQGGQYPLSSVQGPGFMAPFNAPFQAPTGTDDPGFQFAMAEGQKALERSAAARGTLLTGGTLKDLAAYSTGMALQGYGDAWNRARTSYLDAANIFDRNRTFQSGLLGNIANTGAGLASSYGQNAADLITGAGNAQAAGTATSGGIWGNTIGNVANTAAGTILAGNHLRTRQDQQNPPGSGM